MRALPDRGLLPKRLFTADLVAGVSVAAVAIPQSLAYAELAGLPPYHGLYAATLPAIVAAFLASSPYLQTGPVAMTSLLTFGALSGMAAPGSAGYVGLAALLALVVGVGRTAIGMVRLGWVAFLMSQPVLMGFTAAAGILIIASQLPTALGAPAADATALLSSAVGALAHPASWEPAALALSVVTAALVLLGRKVHPLFPGVMVAVLAGLGFGLLGGEAGPAIGAIPARLPPLSLALPWGSLPSLLASGLVIALVGFAEPAAIARTLAAKDRQRWSEDREFVSQGAANLAAGISGGFPVGGSFARSSLNRMAGARTRWSGAVTGLTLLLFLPFAGVLATLPRAVLAAIVISAVVRLVNLQPLREVGRVSRPQAAVGWTTFAATLLLAPRIDWAVLLGIGLAVTVHIWRELRVVVKTRYLDGTLRLTPKGVLFFASAPLLFGTFLDELARHPETERLEVDLRHLGRIDLTGALALKELVREAEEAGLEVELTHGPPQAWRLIKRVMG